MRMINNPTNLAGAITIASFLILFTTVAPTGDLMQDQTFRLMNVERRLDQLQARVDFIERAQQNQAATANTSGSNMTAAAVLELQRMQVSLADQVVQLQKRMLEQQKTIDQLLDRENKQEKKESPKEEPKAKAKPAKP